MRSAPTWSEARSPLSLLGFLPLFLGYTLNTMNLVNGLNFNTIRGDIYGGLTAAVVALPLAMAMGVASGVGPVAGMYGAIFVGFFAALFGGTPAQVSGPTGPMTVVMAAIFIQYTGLFPDNPAHGAALAFTVVILGGLFQIGFGLLRIGRFIELVPHPVVSGFMSGIGVIIILLQIGPLLGHEGLSKPISAATAIPEFVSTLHTSSVMLGLITLAVVYGIPSLLPRLNRLLPSPLMALLVGTLAYILIFQNQPGIRIIGDIPTGFPDFSMPVIELSLLWEMILSGLTLAALGSIDSLLTSLVADNVTRTQHKSDRELIGQGIGNTIAGFFGGLPGAGATMRTVVNVKAGGRTPISGALHAVVLLVIVLGAGAYASIIPKAVLAGILVKVGTDIIDWEYLRLLFRAPKAGVLMMFTVLLLTVFVDLIQAVAIGMVMAAFVFMHRMVQLQLGSIQFIRNPEEAPDELGEEAIQLLKNAKGRLLLYHVGGPLSFGAAKGMIRQFSEHKDFDVLVIDLKQVPLMDFTSSRALGEIIDEAGRLGSEVYVVGARPAVHDILQKQGVLGKVREEYVHAERLDALKDAYKLLSTQ